MLFCIDIGNTNIVLGVAEGDRIVDHWRLRTDKEITADEMGILVKNLLDGSKIRLDDIKSIIIKSSFRKKTKSC